MGLNQQQAATAHGQSDRKTDQPFVVIKGRPMPVHIQPSRPAFPFVDMQPTDCFYAGKSCKGLLDRLKEAIHHQQEQAGGSYEIERLESGDVYVWRIA
jgi:hypothetical protein